MFLKEMQAEGIRRPVTVTGGDGRAPWAVEYRAVRDRDGLLVSITNLWGLPQTVRLAVDDPAVSSIHDLRRAKEMDGGELTLEPLEATVLRVK
jgi:hypothetical protein